MVSVTFSTTYLPSYTINPGKQTEPVPGSLPTLFVSKMTKKPLTKTPVPLRVVHSTSRNSEQLMAETNKIWTSSIRVRTKKGWLWVWRSHYLQDITQTCCGLLQNIAKGFPIHYHCIFTVIFINPIWLGCFRGKQLPPPQNGYHKGLEWPPDLPILPLVSQACCLDPAPQFQLSDLPPLSDSRSSLLIFSSRFEHILFRLWICFCKMKTIRNHQDTSNPEQVSKVNTQAFSSQGLCSRTSILMAEPSDSVGKALWGWDSLCLSLTVLMCSPPVNGGLDTLCLWNCGGNQTSARVSCRNPR